MNDPDIADLGPGDTGDGILIIFSSDKTRHSRVSLVGELDVTTAGSLTDWAEWMAAAPQPAVWLDASALEYADVSGIRALTRACWLLHQRCGWFKLTALSAEARRIADLAGAELPTTEVELTQEADDGLAAEWPAGSA